MRTSGTWTSGARSVVPKLLLLTFMATAIAVVVNARPASAYPGKPLTEWSFYIHTSDTNRAYDLGCNQGNFDRTNGIDYSEVVIDFGVQKSDLSGNILTGNGVFMSKASVEAVAEQFAFGYWVCTGSDVTSILFLDLGTNNDNGTYTSAMGSGWRAS